MLVKEPKGRDVDDADSFSFNAAFSEKLFRIKINSIQMKETEEENKKTNEQVCVGVCGGCLSMAVLLCPCHRSCCNATVSQLAGWGWRKATLARLKTPRVHVTCWRTGSAARSCKTWAWSALSSC